MTTVHDPHHPEYADEAAVRGELTRAFDVCQGCRRCVDLCAAFPTLFDLLDRFDDRDAGRLTPAEQDDIVGACHRCGLCTAGCPYAPGVDEQAIDVAALMVRAGAMRRTCGHATVGERVAAYLVARTSVFGRLPRVVAAVADRLVAAGASSRSGAAVASTFGLASVGRLPSRARVRWSRWFDRRGAAVDDTAQRRVVVLPGCIVEHRDVQVGVDLVEVFERNGVSCRRAAVGCCGAPWLAAGAVDRFAKAANRNAQLLAQQIRDGGGDIVVPEPTCARVLKQIAVDHVDERRRDDARFVAAHTFDAAEYLMRVHAEDPAGLDLGFDGAVSATVSYRPADHLRALGVGLPARDLMVLTGADVRVVPPESGDEVAGDVVVGDNTVANAEIADRTGVAPSHPLSVVARAYGIGPA